ncbi:electron transfer complex subunit TmcD, partial [Thermodesulfobacteriota bacterium]
QEPCDLANLLGGCMVNLNNWDWEIGKRVVADIGDWKSRFEYMEEPYTSPDGEKIAAIVKNEEAEFCVCENGTTWENAFDKVWYLRFGPDNRLTALVSDAGEWTVAVDGKTWENRFEYVWDTRFGSDGNKIIVAAKKEMKYLAVCNDTPWETGYFNMNNLATSLDGKSIAAVVQTEALSEGDIFKFQEGIFTVAVDGKTWDTRFVNVWEMSFSPDHQRVAAEVRTSLYDYTIAVDGVTWDQSYPSVWKPLFNPIDSSVTAPVKLAGAWTLAQDGKRIWDRGFVQLWRHMYSPDGKQVAAIVCPTFGRWTLAVNGNPWATTFGDLVTDAVFSPDGNQAACIGKEKEKWIVCVDDQSWQDTFDMAWKPVFSPDGNHVAAKVEKNNRYTLYIDGRPFKEEFVQVWDPVFSPDSKKLMLRAIEGEANQEKYVRQVLPLTDIIG